MAVETTIRAYKCETCGKIYTDEHVADTCCKQYHCEVCGCKTAKYWLICDNCRSQREFDKATRISLAEYEEKFDGNMVCYHDEFYSDVYDMLEMLNDSGEELPTYCWGTDRLQCVLTDNVLSNLTEDTYEDADFDKEAYHEFNEFVEAWNEKYKLIYYTRNNFLVTIPDEVLAEYKSE